MSRKTQGGSIRPVNVIGPADLRINNGDYMLESNVAMPVEAFTTTPTSRQITGGASMVVYPVSQADIDSGLFKLCGGASKPVADVLVIGTNRKRNSAKIAIPVYPIGGVGTLPPVPPVDGYVDVGYIDIGYVI